MTANRLKVPQAGQTRLEISIPIENPTKRIALYGSADRNLRTIRSAFDVKISARDGVIRLSGHSQDVHRAAHVIEELQRSLRFTLEITEEMLQEAIERANAPQRSDAPGQTLDVFLRSAVISPKSEGQQRYVESILEHDLVFCVGPAGTGKTYLAVAVAVSLLKQHRIKRIVLVRPAVEAGEKLGYLPGDLQAKVNPYLRPLFDAMHDMMSFEQLNRFMQNDVIEVVPLAFMRGRTLNQSVIIMDEAQNATPRQMLMFLTRLGQESKMIVTGDDSQSDLGRGAVSGLTDAIERLQGVSEIGMVRLLPSDIVRHNLVQRIVDVYAGERADDR